MTWLYVENLRCHPKPVRTIEFSKVAGRNNIQKLIVFSISLTTNYQKNDVNDDRNSRRHKEMEMQFLSRSQ